MRDLIRLGVTAESAVQRMCAVCHNLGVLHGMTFANTKGHGVYEASTLEAIADVRQKLNEIEAGLGGDAA